MPLVRKRALHDDAPSKDQPQANPQKRAKVTMYNEFDKIGYSQDQFHTLFRHIPDAIEALQKLLSKHLGCFLNGRGGILCFGVRENGTIYGESITRYQEDSLKQIIDTTLKKFHPLVHPAKYRVSFTPVKATTSRRAETLQVLEIRVNPGDKYQMYEDMDHQVHMRKRGVLATLTPHEIKHLTVVQLRKKMEEEAIAKVKSLPPPSSGTSGVKSHVKSNDVKLKNDVKSNDVKSSGVKPNDVKPNGVKPNDVKSSGVKPNGVKSNVRKEDAAESKLKSCVVKFDIKRDDKKTLSQVRPSCPQPPAHQVRPSYQPPPVQVHRSCPPSTAHQVRPSYQRPPVQVHPSCPPPPAHQVCPSYQRPAVQVCQSRPLPPVHQVHPSYPPPTVHQVRPSYQPPPVQVFLQRPHPPMHSVNPTYPSHRMWYNCNQYHEYWF